MTISDLSASLVPQNTLFAKSRITNEHISQHLTRSFTYTEEGQLSGQTIDTAAGLISRRYEYDETGNLTAKRDNQKGPWRFSYDPMGRITEALSPEHQVEKFAYDPAGDLLEHLPGSDGLRTARYNRTEYRYDAAGNLVQRRQDETTCFDWDENNRLKTVHTPDGARIVMGYDALGRRHRKAVDGERTFFTWDNDALLSEQFEDGPVREYVYYPGTFEPLAVIEGDGTVYYYHNDPNGLPQELTKYNGEVVWSAVYDALGRVDKILVDEVAQPLRMQGQYWDEEIELCYNRHRYFDPQICAFISKDPIGLVGGDNVYAYAPNVWGWVDPLGLSCKMAAPKKPIVLGETMSQRVDPVAKLLDAHTFQPRSKNPARWKINQKRWIKEQMKSERDIFDIGTDRLRPSRSEYYGIEKSELLKAGYEREFQKWVSVDVGGNTRNFRLYKWVKAK